MTTHVPGLQSFFKFFHHFVVAKLAICSIRVKRSLIPYIHSIPCLFTILILEKQLYIIQGMHSSSHSPNVKCSKNRDLDFLGLNFSEDKSQISTLNLSNF